MAIYQRPALTPQLVRRQKSTFFTVLIIWGIGIFIAIGLGLNFLYDNYLYHAGSTQFVEATATRTEHTCDRVMCGYDTFGTYTINSVTETNVRLLHLTKYPVTGQVQVMVNFHRPKLAFTAYSNPYPGYVIASFASAAFGLLMLFLLFMIWQRNVRKLRLINQS